jgi:dipeptidyl aminopeptidase/acylaminoacyl peptidase
MFPSRSRHQVIAACLLSVICASCSFNRVYLQPSPIPRDKKQGKLIDHAHADTTIMNIGKDFQPTFTDTRNVERHYDYSIESVVIKSGSGNAINGWLIKPTKATPLNVTLFFLHGNAGNIMGHYAVAVPLVQKGYQVFIFDYSGFGFSEGKATRSNVLKDADAALKYLVAREDVKNTQIVVYGQSLGGHLAINIAARNPQLIDGLVTEGAFSSHDDIAARYAGFFGRMIVNEQYSGLKAIKKYHKPLLIIHSVSDEVIPYYMGEKLFSKANNPKSFYQIDSCHICGPLYYTDSINAKILRLVKGSSQ